MVKKIITLNGALAGRNPVPKVQVIVGRSLFCSCAAAIVVHDKHTIFLFVVSWNELLIPLCRTFQANRFAARLDDTNLLYKFPFLIHLLSNLFELGLIHPLLGKQSILLNTVLTEMCRESKLEA